MEFMILAGAIQAGASIYNGIQGNAASQSQAISLEEQAKIRREEAILQKRSYADKAATVQKQGDAFVGSQKSAFASSGVKIDKGSPLAVLRESQKSIQSDVSRLRQTGENAFTLGQRQANVLEQQADFTKDYGKQQLAAGFISGGASFLGSLGQAKSYQNYWSGE